MAIFDFIKKHPIASYYGLVFAVSWGIALLVLGPDGFIGKKATNAALNPIVYLGLAGPTIGGIALTSIVQGRRGLRDLFARVVRWRVGARWYAIALLTAPVLTLLSLLGLSLASPSFMPPIMGSKLNVGLLAAALGAALLVATFEEIGWTGFAIPAFRKRYSVLATGFLAGLLWALWHFPMFSGSASSSGFSPVLFLAVILFGWLPAYRVFIVWIYDHTQSVLMAILTHLPITFGALALTPTKPGFVPLTSALVFGAEMWIVALVITHAPHASPRRRAQPVAM